MHPLQVVFRRNLSATFFLLPMLIVARSRNCCRSNAMHLYGVRVAYSCSDDGVVLCSGAHSGRGGDGDQLLGPLFGTVGAILFLCEKLRIRPHHGADIGFIGAMIILRPAPTLSVSAGLRNFQCDQFGSYHGALNNFRARTTPAKSSS